MLRNAEKFSCVRKKRDLKLIAKLKLLKASRLIKKWSNINDLKRLGFVYLIFLYFAYSISNFRESRKSYFGSS